MKKNPDKLITLLSKQLQNNQPPGWAKLEPALGELRSDFSNRRFFHLFALCPRWFEQQPNAVAANHRAEWEQYDPYGVLREWQYPQLARLLVLLQVAAGQAQENYVASINELYKTADVNELILLGQSLAFLPHAESFLERARESVRSNIAPVFSAIAHRSDYARRFFDHVAWNQLVLKAAFLAVPIWSIPGLKERNNPELATMLRHYAVERQAASRSVPWDLWCCIGWLAQSGQELEYLQRQFHSARPKTQAAIALALAENPHKGAQTAAGMLSLPGHRLSELSWPQLAAWTD
jgi:hypothetical protein